LPTTQPKPVVPSTVALKPLWKPKPSNLAPRPRRLRSAFQKKTRFGGFFYAAGNAFAEGIG